jgi:endothelin-converting enzyme
MRELLRLHQCVHGAPLATNSRTNSILKAGGWRKAHPLPSDKGRFGQFNALQQENLAIVQDILNADGSLSLASLSSSADEKLLTKLRDLYSSCTDEDTIDEFGDIPLKEVVRVIRRLYRGDGTEINAKDDGSKKLKKGEGFTAALAYLHSKGMRRLNGTRRYDDLTH